MTIEARAVAYAGIEGILDALTPADRREVLRVVALENPQIDDALPKLTPRERQLLAFYAEGASDEKIGRGLDIAARTAQKDGERLRRKLGAENRAECVAIAFRGGLLT